MNERIKELWEQARIGQSFGHDPDKFAELIVKECAAYLNHAVEVHNQHDQDLCDLAARKLLQHFGVE